MKIDRMKEKSKELRRAVLDMCIKAKTGHLTSSYSCIEIMVYLYYSGLFDFKTDTFILSKAQASPLLYAILADLGYFDKSFLDGFAQKGGMFGVHLQNTVPGVKITAGSLGHGFGIACGIALGHKLDKELPLTIVLMGDGECYEGSVWETAMFASHNRLNNLVVIVDRNYQDATSFTEDQLSLEPLDEKWKSFGWNVEKIDGHNFEDLDKSLNRLRRRKNTKPTVIIAETIKGNGIDYISCKPLWHARAPVSVEDINICNIQLNEE